MSFMPRANSVFRFHLNSSGEPWIIANFPSGANFAIFGTPSAHAAAGNRKVYYENATEQAADLSAAFFL
ncbi:hypothetical protein [Rhodoferax sp.]|nr:hypothetical protein [Rhodoferax sp.]MDD2809496.1 hypothetical protein [Rhodoferax sp.]MDD5479026.1 hypothetical protein [Rhodoferax sp.]